jgi:anti-anti-sigma factor
VIKLIQIAERSVADVVILELAGRMVLEEGDIPLRDYIRTLAQQGRVKVLLDMHDVSRLDSAGIGMLVADFLTLHRHGGTLKLMRLTERAKYLMALTRLNTVFEIFEVEEDAVRSFLTADPEVT